MAKSTVLADFQLADGTALRVEVPKPLDPDAVQEVSVVDEVIYKAEDTLEAALDKITPIATAVMSRIKNGLTTPANEVEVKFGVKLSVESGVILSSVGAEVNFEVTLKWKKD
jgi:hypothetical protein